MVDSCKHKKTHPIMEQKYSVRTWDGPGPFRPLTWFSSKRSGEQLLPQEEACLRLTHLPMEKLATRDLCRFFFGGGASKLLPGVGLSSFARRIKPLGYFSEGFTSPHRGGVLLMDQDDFSLKYGIIENMWPVPALDV